MVVNIFSLFMFIKRVCSLLKPLVIDYILLLLTLALIITNNFLFSLLLTAKFPPTFQSLVGVATSCNAGKFLL